MVDQSMMACDRADDRGDMLETSDGILQTVSKKFLPFFAGALSLDSRHIFHFAPLDNIPMDNIPISVRSHEGVNRLRRLVWNGPAPGRGELGTAHSGVGAPPGGQYGLPARSWLTVRPLRPRTGDAAE
jgi:hypothetical protein